MRLNPCLICSLLACAVVGGCQSSASPEIAAPTTQAAAPATQPRTIGLRGVFLDVYQMTVPAGTVSRNEDFWKRVDEQRVDPATYDLLLKNGVRVGVAPTGDWDYFKGVLETENAHTLKGTASAATSGSVMLTMRKGVRSQDIFYLSDRNELYGRTYDRCDNLMGISFRADPRRPGELRVALSPTVRATRTIFQVKYNGEEREIEQVAPEFLYDLNLRVIIPQDGFLVVAPSPDGEWPTSVGNSFFRKNGDVDQKEQLLVLVPRMNERPELPGAKATE